MLSQTTTGAGARLVPDRPFPAYRFEPGLTPHPYRQEGGHSYGVAEPTAAPLDPDAPFDSEPYLFAFDLFNAGYFWESHVWWEAIWHAHERQGPVADLVRALIRLAAAGVKARARVPGGARVHAQACADILDAVRQETGRAQMAGLDLAAVAAQARALAHATPNFGGHPQLERDGFVWTLQPARGGG